MKFIFNKLIEPIKLKKILNYMEGIKLQDQSLIKPLSNEIKIEND